MKILIIPSDTTKSQHSVILEQQSDELDAQEALHLAKNALVAYGYHYSNIFGEDD